MVSAVKAMRPEFLRLQLELEKDSQASIIPGANHFWTSCLRKESWKMKRRIFKAWTFESSRVALAERSNKKVMVLLSKIGSLESGSALNIAMMVGGIPALLLSIVDKFSVVILSKA